MNRTLTLATAALFAPTVAFAHVGADHVHSDWAGFAHPFTGTDHLLAMVAVGVIGAYMRGRAVWLLPAAFLGAMVAGAAAGTAGFTGLGVEIGIALSLVVLGAVLAFGRQLPLAPLTALVALFGAAHGAAHGTEMPAAMSAGAYFMGFAAATGLLHLAGAALGTVAMKAAIVLRLTGAATLAVGLAALAGTV